MGKSQNDEADVIEKCANLLSEAGISSVPVNLDLLGSFVGISNFVEDDMEEAGRLIPDANGGYVVAVRKTDSTERKRFTKAHEIGHTLVPGAIGVDGHTDHEVGIFDSSKKIEYLCDVAAAHLLMPLDSFAEYVHGKEFSIENIIGIAQYFGTSLEATALQLVKRNPTKRAVVVWERMYKPTQDILLATGSLPGMEIFRPQKEPRILYSFGLSGQNHIPKHKSLDEEGDVIGTAFKTRGISKGTEKICFSHGNSSEFYCEAMMTLEGRVVSILRLL